MMTCLFKVETMFIKLTHSQNKDNIKTIFVNAHNISDLFRDERANTTLISSLYGRYRFVEETPEEILKLIDKAINID